MAKEVGAGRTAGTRRRKGLTMTNGTLVRYMDDAHLAEVIQCPHDTECDLLDTEACYECKLEWLRKEAEHEKTDQEG